MKKYGGAHRVKNITGMAQISIDLKPNRSVSDVYINQKMDLTNLSKYIEKKKKNAENVTYFHAFLTAVAKTVYNRPKLNYFVANRHMWEHDKIVLSFVAKVSFDDHSEEMMVMIPIEKNDTIYTLGEKIRKKVDSFRSKKTNQVEKAGANSAIDTLGKLPNVLRIPIIGIFKWCDKKGILPSSLCQDNLYYSTMILSNLGSIGCGAIHHNITDFGNSSSLLTMGEIRDEEVIIDGKKEIRKMCEWGMNFDERIADGYYFAKSADLLQYFLSNPEELEKPGSITPHTEFEAQVYILKKEEGGRHTPFSKGYKPQFYFRTTDVTGEVELPADKEIVMPGDQVTFKVKLLAPVAMNDQDRFAIREGGKTVGSGVITKVIK